ncbi:hypothetical protein E1262_05205 [Jiangella aurantiaca]|uniref:Uncharacterized protein n=1 Tax=Jiangella aurantiaca TaxID=2530373 RepID=A0A4R5AG29_9ACTN|nr:hypothetical protein [Jiangella aurantiaca]TDD71553.1 hypothetical protein E1262_05205 [Jiangella aurantiaca]
MLLWIVLVLAACGVEMRPAADVTPPIATTGAATGSGSPSPAVPVEVTPGAAVLMPADDVGGLEPLSPPLRLVTPAATVTVEAVGGWDLRARTDDLVARVWRVRVAAPTALAPSADPFLTGTGTDRPPRDAATTLWLDTGSERLPVTRDGIDDPLVLPCDDLPCADRGPEEHLLVAATADDAEPALIATVDGADQRLDLDTGEVTSSVSRVAYDRPTTVPVSVPGWPPRTIAVRTQEQLEAEFGTGAGDITRGGLDVGYGGRVAEMYLSPFDRYEGWAPPGHAWLVLRVDDHLRQPANTSWRAELDAAASWTVAHDAGMATPAYPPALSNVLAFLVPDDLRSVTLAYRPIGTVGLPPDAQYDFQAPEPLTAEVPLP